MGLKQKNTLKKQEKIDKNTSKDKLNNYICNIKKTIQEKVPIKINSKLTIYVDKKELESSSVDDIIEKYNNNIKDQRSKNFKSLKINIR
jgi:hypothetical protein